MPARKRKKQKTRLKAAPFLWIGVVVNTSVGVMFSPITNLRRVVVDGGDLTDRPALEAAIQRWAGTPCMQINPRAIEGDALEIAGVRSANLSRNIFGSGRLKLTYRVPTVVLEENHAVGVSWDGVMFPLAQERSDLPTLRLTYFPRPSFSLFSTYDGATLARLASDAKTAFPRSTIGIVIEDSGTLCLNVDGVRCVFGTNQDLIAKLDVAKVQLTSEILQNAEGVTLNLMDPKSPTVSGLKRAKK